MLKLARFPFTTTSLSLITLIKVLYGFSINVRDDGLLYATSEAVNDILKANQEPQCSVVLVNNEDVHFSTMSKVISILSAPSGVGIINVPYKNNWDDFITNLNHNLMNIKKLRVLSKCFTIVIASEHQDFFGVFANASVNSRLLIWSTRVIVVTSLPYEPLRLLLGRYPSFAKMNAMAVALRKTKRDTWCDIFSHFPYEENGPRMVRIGRWTPQRGLSFFNNAQLFPAKYDNFHGTEFLLGVFELHPYYIKSVRKNSRGEEVVTYSGRCALLLEVVAAKLNFTYVFQEVMLAKHLIDIIQEGAFASVLRLAMLTQFLERAEFTFFIEKATLAFVMATPTLEPKWQSLLYPLQPSVWGFIIITLLIMPIFFIMTRRAPSSTPSSPEECEDGFKQTREQIVILRTLGIFLGQDTLNKFSKDNATRLLLFAWLMASFVIGTVYRTNLMASLMVPRYPQRLDTLEQLVESDVSIRFKEGSSFYNYFSHSKLESHKKIVQRSGFLPSNTVGYQTVAKDHNTAFVTERLNTEMQLARLFPNPEQRSKIYISSENILPIYAAWVVPLDAPYKENINKVLMSVSEAGLIPEWSKNTISEEKKRILRNKMEKDRGAPLGISNSHDEDHSSTRLIALTLVHYQGPFFMIILGQVIASSVFTLELLIQVCADSRVSVPF